MKPVTDPNVLQQLNSTGMKPVTDEAVLAQLNQKTKAPSGIAQGILDPVYGAGQLIPRGLELVTSAGGLAPNPISNLYKQSYERTIDPAVKEREQGYEQGRAAAGKTGLDWGRIAGNMANPVNYVGGAGMLPTLARGAAFGAMQPVSDTENYGEQKAWQAGGGAFGAGLAKGVGDKIIAPVGERATQVARLLKEKVPLTLGQRSGGFVKAIEDKATSILGLGDMIKKAQERSVEGLNKAAYARVLDSIDEKIPKDLPIGRSGIDFISDKVSEKYNNLLPKLTGKVDDKFKFDLVNLKNMVGADDIMDAAEKAKYNKIVANLINKRISKSGGITGQAIKEIESELGQRVDKFSSGTASVSQRQLADALKETQSVMRKMVKRSNPSYGEELSAIDKAFANLTRVQSAGSARGAQDGVFSPSMLQSAVRAGDKTVRKNAYARGKALMQDLADAGGVLPNKIPNSGTVDRAALLGLGITGLGGYGQTDAPLSNYAGLAAAVLAPSLLYTKTGVAAQNALAQGLRSQAAQSVLKPIGQALPYAGAPLATGFTAK